MALPEPPSACNASMIGLRNASYGGIVGLVIMDPFGMDELNCDIFLYQLKTGQRLLQFRTYVHFYVRRSTIVIVFFVYYDSIQGFVKHSEHSFRREAQRHPLAALLAAV
jgi:hypothetical protein